jgi:hypothetical protein
MLDIILLHTCNLGNAIFAWSILSWIIIGIHPLITLIVFQLWYKILHDSWCRICFLSFASYFRTSLLCFPNLDIKSFNDSQIMHFTNTNPCFHTSKFKWCLFLNLLTKNWEVPPMFNSLLIANPQIQKKKKY